LKTNELASVIAAILVVAGLSVAVSRNADTANVLRQGLDGFSGVIKAAQGR
jgi:hypothetical protein